MKKEFLNFKETLTLLNCSASTLYKLTSSKKVPFYKPTNGKLYFDKEEVLSWLTANQNPKEEN